MQGLTSCSAAIPSIPYQGDHEYFDDLRDDRLPRCRSCDVLLRSTSICMTPRRTALLLLLIFLARPTCNTHAENLYQSSHGNYPGSNPDTYEGPSVAAILSWATKAGISSHHFANDTERAVRGLIAKHDIPPKTSLVTMKRSMSLSLIIGQNSPFPDLASDQIWTSCGENRQLALVLLKEAKQASQSKFKLYLESLPNEVNQQLLDTEQDYDRLKNTPLVTSLGITLEDLMWATDIVNSRSFAIPKALAWSSPLSLGSIAVSVAALSKAPFISRWRYVHKFSGSGGVAFMLSMGASLLLSTAFSAGNLEFALVPIMDLLNHNSSNTVGQVQGSIFSDTLKLVSGQDAFKAGQEVTHSYGDKSNEALLQFYGFVETDNPHDVYTADIADWVTAHHPVETERWQFLETSPVVTQSLKQAELRQQGWSDGVMQSLRYLLAPQQDIDERQTLDPFQWALNLYKHRELPHIMTPWKDKYSPTVEQQVYKVLYGVCSHLLALKSTTLEADQQLLEQLSQSTGSTERQRLALQFRIGKKTLLKSCIQQYDLAHLAQQQLRSER